MDNTFLKDRITATKAQIVAYEDASLAFGTSNIQSYILDTGQSRQNVTRAELSQLQSTLEGLYNRLAVFEARLTGNGTSIGIPRW